MLCCYIIHQQDLVVWWILMQISTTVWITPFLTIGFSLQFCNTIAWNEGWNEEVIPLTWFFFALTPFSDRNDPLSINGGIRNRILTRILILQLLLKIHFGAPIIYLLNYTNYMQPIFHIWYQTSHVLKLYVSYNHSTWTKHSSLFK